MCKPKYKVAPARIIRVPVSIVPQYGLTGSRIRRQWPRTFVYCGFFVFPNPLWHIPSRHGARMLRFLNLKYEKLWDVASGGLPCVKFDHLVIRRHSRCTLEYSFPCYDPKPKRALAYANGHTRRLYTTRVEYTDNRLVLMISVDHFITMLRMLRVLVLQLNLYQFV